MIQDGPEETARTIGFLVELIMLLFAMFLSAVIHFFVCSLSICFIRHCRFVLYLLYESLQ